jgi:hypothetical protein
VRSIKVLDDGSSGAMHSQSLHKAQPWRGLPLRFARAVKTTPGSCRRAAHPRRGGLVDRGVVGRQRGPRGHDLPPSLGRAVTRPSRPPGRWACGSSSVVRERVGRWVGPWLPRGRRSPPACRRTTHHAQAYWGTGSANALLSRGSGVRFPPGAPFARPRLPGRRPLPARVRQQVDGGPWAPKETECAC